MKTLLSIGVAAASCVLNAAELSANGVEVNGNVETKCERRVFDDGIAIRYSLPDGARRISRELTEWRLPEDAVVWFQGDLNGFADYELPYESCKVGDLPVGRILSLPVTAKLPDGTYRMMTEANVVDYTDLALKYAGGGRFVAYYHADRDGFGGPCLRVASFGIALSGDRTGSCHMVQFITNRRIVPCQQENRRQSQQKS